MSCNRFLSTCPRSNFRRNAFFGLALIIEFLLFLTLPTVRLAQQRSETRATAPNEQDVRTLEKSSLIERELVGGQTHFYQFKLVADEFVYLVVDQRGIDVAVTLIGLDGKPLLEVNSPNGTEGPEPVYWISETAGVYGLSVRAQDKDAKPGRYEVRVVELRAATDQDRALFEARRLLKESEDLWKGKKFAEAMSSAERALGIREKILGTEHLEVAEVLENLAYMHTGISGFATAESLLKRVVAIREKILGPEHGDLANALNNLGILYLNLNNYAQSEPLLQRGLDMRRNLFGDNHPAVAQSLSNMARLYLGRGEYDKAEPLYQRALAIWEKSLKPDDPTPAASLNGLATIYNNKGNYAEAERLYQRALELREKAFGLEDQSVAAVLNNMAMLRNNQGRFDEAEQLFNRALPIFEKNFGAENAEVATLLNNLGWVHESKGDYDKAESFYRRALAIREKKFGAESLSASNTLANLAAMYKNKGDYDKAESYYQRALAIEEKIRGSWNPTIASLLNNMAILYAAKGQTQKAVTTQFRAAEISEFYLNRNIAIGSEREKLAYLGTFSGQTNWIVSLHVNSAPKDSAARDLALTTILRRKGRALDTMVDSFAALRQRATLQDQALLDQLQNANAQLARATMGGVQKMTLAEHQAKVKSLVEQVEKLEDSVSSHFAEFRAQSQPITIAAVQAAIPDDSALVEFFTYRPFDVTARGNRKLGGVRYVTYVLNREGEARWVDLGESGPIEQAIEKWRNSLRSGDSKDVRQLARKVDELVMSPVRTLLGQTRHVLLSPDADLNLIPFAALVDERGRFLIEHYSFTYLTSGRDLLRFQTRLASRSAALIVADPVFGDIPGSQLTTLSTSEWKNCNLNSSFGRLLSGKDQAREVHRLLPEATLLTGEQATETALKHASAPRILHVVTHGFFCDGPKPLSIDPLNLSQKTAQDLGAWLTQGQTALLRSGLVLAGANLRKSGDDDGLLTAVEAAGLDLHGTKLVVLSACDTGLGDVGIGEGVYGLRRALVLAGAESQVVSLWRILDDERTSKLITDYYRALQKGEGRSEALRQAQLNILKQYPHPYFWAAFLPIGEWANLDGQRVARVRQPQGKRQ